MKKVKSCLALLLAVVLVLTVFAACGAKDNGSATPTSSSVQTNSGTAATTAETAAAENPYKEKLTISIGYWDIGKLFAKPDPFTKMMQDKFNVTVTPVDFGWVDYDQKTKVLAASGGLPDVFVQSLAANGDYTTYNNWIKQGIIRDIPLDDAKYPNLAKVFKSQDVDQTLRASDGKFYAMPRMNVNTPDGWCQDGEYIVRKDWMEKLGISDPKSWNEFYAMLNAFVTQDPGGLGKGKVIGMLPGLTTLFLSTDLPQITNNMNAWISEDGKFIPAYASKKFPDAFAKIKKLYTDGLLYKDFAIDKAPDEKMLSLQAGVMPIQYSEGILTTENAKFEKLNPGKKWMDYFKVLKPWANDLGDAYHQTMLTYWSETYLNKSSMDDKKTDRIMRIMDWSYSDEGEVVLHNGLENDYTYDKENKKVVATRAKDDKGQLVDLSTLYPSFYFWSNFAFWPVGQQNEMPWIIGRSPDAVLPPFVADSIAQRQDVLATTKTVPMLFAIDAIMTPAKSKYNANFKDDFTRMILSKNDVKTDVDNMLKTYEAKGLSKVIDEVNAQAAAQGIKP